MTTDKCKDAKYVVLMCLIGALLVLGSAINEVNILDVMYLIFIACCLIRYLYLSIKS